MASRRARHQGAPVSFFSFQDIILSVTGILILVTLLLTLELVTRVDVSSSTPLERPDPEQLAIQIAHAETERQAIHREIEAMDRHLAEISKAPAGVAAGSIEELRGAVQARLTANQQLGKDIQEAWHAVQERQRRRDALAEKTDVLTAETEKLKADAATAAAATEQKHRIPENRLFFLPGDGGGKQPLVVECRETLVRVGRPNEQGELMEIARWSGRSVSRDFRAWAASRDSSREYFVLFTRPDGVRQYEALRLALRETQFDVGWDAVDSGLELFADQPQEEAP